MIELPLIFVSGVLGSAHCIGMCGPIAMALGADALTWRANLRRQIVYSVGRLFTYAMLGMTAGFCGQRLLAALPSLSMLPAWLAIISGVFLLYQGMRAAGWLPQRIAGDSTPCLAGSLFATLLSNGGASGAFLAGVFTGFIPCGLVYGLLALATSTGSLTWGAAVMALFGLGTFPVMIATGCGTSLMHAVARQRIYRLAAWCVVAMGIVCVARGVGSLGASKLPADSGHPSGGFADAIFCR